MPRRAPFKHHRVPKDVILFWRAVDQSGAVLNELLQCRRDKKAAKRLLYRMMKKQARPPMRFITD